ncbi:MAG TPA: phosphopantetheine-binding protein [Terriglobales bacterium]|nr:phosphopantetheine-binding protein [Terriglobales bacterium]
MRENEQKRVRDQVVSLFSSVLHVDVPSGGVDLFEAGILDSQNLVDLLLSIEQQFEIEILLHDFELDNFRCVDKITSLILEHQAPKHA